MTEAGLDVNGVAIIGLACRFPGAQSADELWQNTYAGVDSITRLDRESLLDAGVSADVLDRDGFISAVGSLVGSTLFDPQYFDITARDARLLNPQHRLMLEVCFEAFQDAAVDPHRFDGKVGVFAGAATNDYEAFARANVKHVDALELEATNDKDFLSTRVSYAFDLRGPSMTIQSACSTGLVAVHQAALSLLNYECDLALAGAAAVSFPTQVGYIARAGDIAASDGYCRPFDNSATGTMAGDGVGVVLLKRLGDAIADGDVIHAVIHGSAVNNDGRKANFASVRGAAQEEVFRSALSMAEATPERVAYVEAHGSGTSLGDVVELESLSSVYGKRASGPPCIVSSVKGNVGHLREAAGICGLIRLVKAIENRTIPPTAHFRELNRAANVGESIEVRSSATPWPVDEAPLGAVTSLGLGGTNAHIIVGAAPQRPPVSEPTSRADHLMVLSAPSLGRLTQYRANLDQQLQSGDTSIGDVAHTLQLGRSENSWRGFKVISEKEGARASLDSLEVGHVVQVNGQVSPRIGFCFSGTGDQYAGMGSDLYTSLPGFKARFDQLAELVVRASGVDIRPYVEPRNAAPRVGGENPFARSLIARRAPTESNDPRDRELFDARHCHPFLFAFEYALASSLIELGVRPSALGGHSLGELVAACIAGVMNVEDAVRFVCARAEAVAAGPSGAMAAVPLSEDEAREVVSGFDNVWVAAANAPRHTVISGEPSAVQRCVAAFVDNSIPVIPLPTSHAFHTPMLSESSGSLGRDSMQLSPASIPLQSNVTGGWMDTSAMTDIDYWAHKQLVNPVRYCDNLRGMLDQTDLLIEIGPGSLLSWTAQIQGDHRRVKCVATVNNRWDEGSNLATVLQAVGAAWSIGTPIDWQRLSIGAQKARVVAPPFERQEFTFPSRPIVRGAESPGAAESTNATARDSAHDEDQVDVAEAAQEEIHSQSSNSADSLVDQFAEVFRELIGVTSVKHDDHFFHLGGDSFLGTHLKAYVQERFGVDMPSEVLFADPTPRGMTDAVQIWTQRVEVGSA